MKYHGGWIALAGMFALLGGCGGGGSDAPAAAPAAAPAVAAVAVNGTAATATAVSGRTVEAKCSSGSATATSNAAGAYAITITGGVLPCMVRITTASGVILHSVATGSGTSATANITPVSELAVARLYSADPEATYASFGATAATAATAPAVQAAQAAVIVQLSNSGIDLSGVGDVITATLIPATSTSAGNALGQALASLDSSLTSSATTLPQLTAAVAASGSTAVASSAAASLPADVLLRPRSATCGALRSGTYRLVDLRRGATIDEQTGSIVVDAVAGTFHDTAPGSPIETLVNAATGTCIFGETAVSQSGVIVARYIENGESHVYLAFPQQSIAVSELAGTWNALGLFDQGGGQYQPIAFTTSITAAGAAGPVTYCENLTTCTLEPGPLTLAIRADGGFDLRTLSTGWTDRVFAYRSGSGDLMLVEIAGDGVALWTRQRAIAIPDAGTVTAEWNIGVDNTLAGFVAPPTTRTFDKIIVPGINYMTNWAASGPLPAHSEFWTINRLLTGYVKRSAAINSEDLLGLTINGMGIRVDATLGPGRATFAVTKP